MYASNMGTLFDEEPIDNSHERKAINKIGDSDPYLRRFVLHRLNRLTYDVRTLIYPIAAHFDVNEDLMSIIVYRELLKEIREQQEIVAATAIFNGATYSNVARAAGVTQGGLKNAMPDLKQLCDDFNEVLETGKTKVTEVRGSTRRILHPKTAGAWNGIPMVEYRDVPELGEDDEPYENNVVAITTSNHEQEPTSDGEVPAVVVPQSDAEQKTNNNDVQ